MIQILPDHIANQIAAGEVIQRPASAVKELLENAVDAGATSIELIIQDAGKSLVQVIDNGKGMSVEDARLCFARHATSKISSIEDLFHIRTMGFRGEALASIAAVAQVELKTKLATNPSGIFIEVEHSAITREEPIGIVTGTSLAMKNLFFNIPARRNFLKSNAAEMRHIIEEFTRVAMAFPTIQFSLHANNQQLYQLEAGSLKQRIVQLLGSNYASKLVGVQEETDYLTIRGFVGKPDFARKTRGDQYFFVNNRFIKSSYLHHAVMNAFQALLPADHFPLYVLFIDLDPQQVDINVHPTKQEIKFEDDKIVYAFVQAAIRHALAQFSITPTLDFELDASIQQLDSIQQPFTEQTRSAIQEGNLYQHFKQKDQAHRIEPDSTQPAKNWKPFQPLTADYSSMGKENFLTESELGLRSTVPTSSAPNTTIQLLQSYILFTQVHTCTLINQQAAHERILYEKFIQQRADKKTTTQPLLFPNTIALSITDASLLEELLADLTTLGFLIKKINTTDFLIQGVPAGFENGKEETILETVLEEYKHFNAALALPLHEKLCRSLAKQQAIKAGTPLSEREMNRLITDLFACKESHLSPFGVPVFRTLQKEEIEQLLLNR
ncbi:MAG: DNA mismatch repair endonuclease MutL [Bacteroidetes bacterium]|nr:DNA mismatch repair endonuclease MutL [Bacteroidota bacterium]